VGRGCQTPVESHNPDSPDRGAGDGHRDRTERRVVPAGRRPRTGSTGLRGCPGPPPCDRCRSKPDELLQTRVEPTTTNLIARAVLRNSARTTPSKSSRGLLAVLTCSRNSSCKRPNLTGCSHSSRHACTRHPLDPSYAALLKSSIGVCFGSRAAYKARTFLYFGITGGNALNSKNFG